MGRTPFDLAEDRHCFKAGQTGEMHIHQGEVDIVLLDDVDRLFAAFGEQGAISRRLKDVTKRLPNSGIVVGDQYRVGMVESHASDDLRQLFCDRSILS